MSLWQKAPGVNGLRNKDITRILGTTGHILKIVRSLNVLTKICKLLQTFLLQILKDLADSGRPFRSQLSSCKDCGGSYSTLKVLSCLCFPSQTAEVNAVKKRRNTQSKRKLNCPAKIKLRDILAFPQFKVRLPFEMENELVHAILNNKSITSTSFLQPTLSNLYCLPAS